MAGFTMVMVSRAKDIHVMYTDYNDRKRSIILKWEKMIGKVNENYYYQITTYHNINGFCYNNNSNDYTINNEICVLWVCT